MSAGALRVMILPSWSAVQKRTHVADRRGRRRHRFRRTGESANSIKTILEKYTKLTKGEIDFNTFKNEAVINYKTPTGAVQLWMEKYRLMFEDLKKDNHFMKQYSGNVPLLATYNETGLYMQSHKSMLTDYAKLAAAT